LYKYLLIFLILIPSTCALSIDLDYTTLGPEQEFIGNIEIKPGNYDPNSIIKISTTESSDSKKLKDVVDCDEIDCSGVLDYYIPVSTTTVLSIQGKNILTGIRIPKNYILQSGAKFDIKNADSDYPNTPIIDIGNDDNPEWIYQGYATENFPPDTDYSGPPLITDIEEIIITQNCQRLLLPKSTKYQIRAYTKGTSTLSASIKNQETEVSCNSPSLDWGWTTCTLNLTESLETNYYYVCLESQEGNILAANSSALNPQGYTNCGIDCQKAGMDFIIQVKAADYISKLSTTETYSVSNTRPGEYLYTTLSSFYKNCNFYEDYCTIPIKVTSKNNGTIELLNLEYTIHNEEKDLTINKKHFLVAPPIKTSGENRITSSNSIIIPLSEFDITTPEDIEEYELSVEFNNNEDNINYKVEEIPLAKFNLSKELASVAEQISFDASESTSPNDNSLKFEWDFGDNKTGKGMLTAHRYLASGTYTITLNITDTKKNISSIPLKKDIEIFSSENEIKNLVSSTLFKVESAISYMNSADTTTKQIYTDLDFNQKLIQAKSTLTTYQSKSSTLSQLQLQNAQENINGILATLPSKISITRTLNVIPYLSYEDINEIYPSETSIYKETLHNLNSRITQKTEAKLISTTYLSNNIENYILVKKIITPQNSLKDVTIIEKIPLTLTTSENIKFFGNEPKITTSGNYIEARISYNNLASSSTTIIIYKLPSSNIDLIKNIKTIIVPKDLVEEIIPFECGNNICNPAEDYLSCPEDCTCGNKICDLNEDEQNCPQDCRKTSWFLIFLFLLFVAIIAGIGYYAHKNPSFARKLKIDKILQKLNFNKLIKLLKRNPFTSETELKNVVSFVKRSKKKGYPIMKIREALERKGWSQDKINYAIKKAKS